MALPTQTIPYDPDFLGGGFTVPLPALSPELQKTAFRDGEVLDYVHFSLVMSKTRKMALYSACNIDAERKVTGISREGISWRLDERAEDAQLWEAVYKKTAWDHGHLTRREDVLWGTRATARAANETTFFMTNAAPQHFRFNQDEWVALEDWVLDIATDLSYKLCVFTGPVLSENDPLWFPAQRAFGLNTLRTVQVPAAFWKVIALRDERAGGRDLAVIGFAMRQTEMWDDRNGAKMLDLKVHQVPLQTIEEWTGLSFGTLKNADELVWPAEGKRGLGETEMPVIEKKSDLRLGGNERRREGYRVEPQEKGATRALGQVGRGAEGNIREEVAALRARVDVLEAIVAEQKPKMA